MTVKYVLSIILLNVSFTINAAIITVDNKYPYAGDYQTLQAAHDAASPGDTIFVAPSMQPYSGITVTKRPYFIGVGFEITENIGEPFTATSSIYQYLAMTFNPGAEGSWLEGFDGNFIVNIQTDNITLKRNNLLYILFSNSSGCSVIQNKIISCTSCVNSEVIELQNASGILICNNIIIHERSGTFFGIQYGSNLTIKNNVIKTNGGYCLANISGSEITNNILVYGGLTGNNCSFRYNAYHTNSALLSAGVGNLQNVDMNTVFVDLANYDFHLLPSSPAKGAGEFGTDMGIYGGDAPYVDGGFPGLPSILQILAPTVGSQTSGLNIQFKAKSNKE